MYNLGATPNLRSATPLPLQRNLLDRLAYDLESFVELTSRNGQLRQEAYHVVVVARLLRREAVLVRDPAGACPVPSLAGAQLRRASTNSRATMAPSPRTSPIRRQRPCHAWNLASTRSPIRRARAGTPSRSSAAIPARPRPRRPDCRRGFRRDRPPAARPVFPGSGRASARDFAVGRRPGPIPPPRRRTADPCGPTLSGSRR